MKRLIPIARFVWLLWLLCGGATTALSQPIPQGPTLLPLAAPTTPKAAALAARKHLRDGRIDEALSALAGLSERDTSDTSNTRALDDLAAAGAALHRRLSMLDSGERFETLRSWTLPSSSSDKVRSLELLTALDSPPPDFARALGERPRRDAFAAPHIGEVTGVFSTAWELALAANESGNLRRLRAEVAPLAERLDPRAILLYDLLEIVGTSRPDERLRDSLIHRAAELSRSADNSADNSADMTALVLAAACLTRPWLQPIAEDLLKAQLDRGAARESTWLRLLLTSAYVNAVRSRFNAPFEGPFGADGPHLQYWISASGGEVARERAFAQPIWLAHEDHVLHLAGYQDDWLLFRYPLTGNFEFACEVQAGGRYRAAGGLVCGGQSFELDRKDGQVVLRAAGERARRLFACPFVANMQHATFNSLSLRVAERESVFCVNHHPTCTLASNTTNPWVGLRASGAANAVFRDISITGNPVVPREVRLLSGESLAGWMSPGEAADWLAKDGLLEGRQDAAAATGAIQSSIQYFRPLQEDESIHWEFHCGGSGQVDVHPALGRLAFLIEPSGVRLHWLTTTADDWTGLPEDNAVAAPLDRRGPKPLPLRPGEWNQLTATLSGGAITLSLNGVDIYSRELELGSGRRFGFYRDRRRPTARIRNIVLRGDWPERLTPERLATLLSDVSLRAEAERRSLGVVFDDRHVPGSALAVGRHAASLSPDQRFEFLEAWVMPNADHPTIRTAFDFAPTHPAPLMHLQVASNAAGPMGSVRSCDFVCPAATLVQLAKERGALDDLRQRVANASSNGADHSRSQAAMLALIEWEDGDFMAANRAIDTLERHLTAADLKGFREHWPETLIIQQSVERAELREAGADLARRLLERLRAGTVSGPVAWERHIGTWAAQLDALARVPSPDIYRSPPAESSSLLHWLPVNRETARSRGLGFPLAEWQSLAAQVDHRSGHQDDYLFFESPLRGDYQVECELGAFGWRDTHLMVGGSWLAPHYDHLSYVVGNFREERPRVAFEPRLPTTGEWIRWRAVVKDDVVTTYLNGRELRKAPLPEERDPWIAIRSPYYGFGGARDVRISGTPWIPKQIRISAPADLPGWLPYFDETFGGERGDWRFDREQPGGGIVGARRTDLPGAGLESLLRYHRPMKEDGVIEYEFYYSPNKAHVHPTLDRRAFILEPAGVQIHWVTDGAYDRTDADPNNKHAAPASRRGPQLLPLSGEAWNHMRLEVTGDIVRLSLNGQQICECVLEAANQRVLGLFHYADQTEARVRNMVWHGGWPLETQPVADQELAERRVAILDSRLSQLPAVFAHDFARDGLPLWRFHVYDAGWEEHMEPRPEGLYVRRPCGKESVRFVVSPRMHVHGDFDAIAEFQELAVSPTGDGKWGISLRAVFNDKDSTLCSVFRGMVRSPGQHDQQIAVGEYTQWKPGGRTNIWYPGKVSEEAVSGRLRLARRGDIVSGFIAEDDSPNFRHIHSEKVTREIGRYDGIRLRTGAYSKVDGDGAASVVWKSLVVRAEALTNLPVKPIAEQ